MPFRRPSGSDHSIRLAAVARTSGAVAMRRDAHTQKAESMRPYLARGQNWRATQERDRQHATTELLEGDVAAGPACIDRPNFARLQASIAEQQLDWAWQHSPDLGQPRGQRERSEARPTDREVSARALWLGGLAFALLAAGVIWAVAMVQPSRPLPLETWIRRDLMQRAVGIAALPRPDGMAALTGVAAAPPEPVRIADRVPAEIDAALGVPGGVEPTEIAIAGLGPILGSAATAKELAAGLATRSLPGVMIGCRAERLLPGPPRPALKPTLVSSRGEPEEPARPATMP
jgi:hypothetical protein